MNDYFYNALFNMINILFCFADFQNYLRTQTGNNTTVNIIISTVDYLLRLQVPDVFTSPSTHLSDCPAICDSLSDIDLLSVN